MLNWDYDRCQKCGGVIAKQPSRGRKAKNCDTCRQEQAALYRKKKSHLADQSDSAN